jgi:hypothetical protein
MLKGLENQSYLLPYLISNIVALVLLLSVSLWPRATRLAFLLLFGWAAYTNLSTVLSTPQVYEDYANLAFLDLYVDFIRGWFSAHTEAAVSAIALGQALIAVSMALKGWVFKAGAIGAIVFLVAIGPLGVGSAFPCTLIMAVAMGFLLQGNQPYLWDGRPVQKGNSMSYPWRIN